MPNVRCSGVRIAGITAVCGYNAGVVGAWAPALASRRASCGAARPRPAGSFDRRSTVTPEEASYEFPAGQYSEFRVLHDGPVVGQVDRGGRGGRLSGSEHSAAAIRGWWLGFYGVRLYEILSNAFE